MIPALSRNSAPLGLKVPYPHHRSTSSQQHRAIGAGVTRQLPSLQQNCAEGAYKIAYAQYKSQFRGYAKISQKVNAGKLLAPSTRLGLYA